MKQRSRRKRNTLSNIEFYKSKRVSLLKI